MSFLQIVLLEYYTARNSSLVLEAKVVFAIWHAIACPPESDNPEGGIG
jgi:hypothetical protein